MLLSQRPSGQVKSTLILAHGAGAPMDSPFMENVSERLVARGVAVVRFEFPYMSARREDGRKRPLIHRHNCSPTGVWCMSRCDSRSQGHWL